MTMDDAWLDLGTFGGGANRGAAAVDGGAPSTMLPPAKRAKKTRSSRASEVVDSGRVGEAELVPVQPRFRGRQPTHTYAMKMAAELHGRVCTLCNQTDRDPDPITPRSPRLWGGYKKQKNSQGLQTEGSTCWYCLRVWNVNYMGRMNLTTLKSSRGTDHKLMEEFDKYLHWLIGNLAKQFEECGDRDALHVLSWPSAPQLLQMDIFQIVWTKPKQKYLDIATYMGKYGDPHKRGDIVVDGPGGVKLVRIASEEAWKREEKIIYQAAKQRVYDNGDDEMMQGNMDDRFQALVSSMGHSTLVGASASPGGSAAQSSGSSAPPPAAASGERPAMPAVEQSSDCGSGVPRAPRPSRGGSGQSGGGVKLAAKSGAKVAAKGRGRPKRDAATLLRAALREFSVADASSKYFNNEWKSVLRNWQNYLADLAKMIEAEEDPGVLEELQLLDKKVNAVRAVCSKLQSAGATSGETVSCYKRQMHFLTSPPACDNPFPRYLKRLMHSQEVEDTWPATTFWPKMFDEVLADIVDVSEGEIVESFQLNTVAAKVMLLAQDNGLEGMQANLLSFCEAFPGSAHVKSQKACRCRALDGFQPDSRSCVDPPDGPSMGFGVGESSNDHCVCVGPLVCALSRLSDRMLFGDHPLKLERYREDSHDACARMTHAQTEQCTNS